VKERKKVEKARERERERDRETERQRETDRDRDRESNTIPDLHDAVPVVSSSNAKQRQKCDTEVAEMGVSVESLAWMFLRTFCNNNNINNICYCYSRCY